MSKVLLKTDFRRKGFHLRRIPIPQRKFYVVKFKEGHVLRVKVWNHQVASFFVPSSVSGSWTVEADNLKKYRFRVQQRSFEMLQAASESGSWYVDMDISLVLDLVSTLEPIRVTDSCIVHGTTTLTRAAQGWFGIFRQQHLAWKEEEGIESTPLGARYLDIVLELWSLMGVLEELYGMWEVRATGELLTPLALSVKWRFAEVDQLIREIQDREMMEDLSELLETWRPALTPEGAKLQALEYIREVPAPGMVVRYGPDNKIVQVESLHTARPKNTEVIVSIETAQGVRLNVTSDEWRRLVQDVADEEELGWRVGSTGIRYGVAFYVVNAPKESIESPMESSLWARVALQDGSGEAFALVRPECPQHPALGQHFVLEAHALGTFRVVRVDVVDEFAKVVKLVCRLVEREVHEDFLHAVWSPGKSCDWFARRGQLRLELDTYAGELQVSRCTALTVTVKIPRKKHVLVPVSFFGTLYRGHVMVVVGRVTSLLERVVDHVWNADFDKDQISKRHRRYRKTAIRVVEATIIAGIVAGSVGAAAVAIGGLASGAGLIAAVNLALESTWGFMAGNVFGLAFNFMPPGLIGTAFRWASVQVQAQLIAQTSLSFAETFGAAVVASNRCPLNLDANGTQDPTGMDSVCSQQELNKIQKNDFAEMKRAKRNQGVQGLSKQPSLYQQFKDKLCPSCRNSTEIAFERAESSVFLMRVLARAVAVDADMRCMVAADADHSGKYVLGERDDTLSWS
uniref:Uncharacterized protein n=1 Tax=Noctiluca scintillans TaxID=2966 RepID=A0A7S1FEU1_NOCSC|eukprot:CAMPEP_0194497858 /NCGR_PEP_ID=MMETSP0253-20130528/14668_1 /TAXON_ID=2966 /ORGANISM="Noctiluca scintillans" /LENGTH=740 /DNA_ID=CAMNT_0039339413 /DNA_START=86 /DNA_END=2308 /DNA_ORIENTATION=-